MSVSAVGASQATPITPERSEGPAPDHDGDADDGGATSSVQAAPTPGTGTVVDKTA